MTSRKCPDPCISRRDMVSLGLATGVVVACGEAKTSGKGGGDSGTVVPVSNGTITLDFTSYPNLKTVGGSYRINANGTPLSVTRTSETAVVAVKALCTHEGATLNGFSGSGFSCPLHGATFTTEGIKTGGPGQGNLTSYSATVEATGVKVSVG